MAAPDYFARKSSGTQRRPHLSSALPSTPGSPHTPLLGRSLSSQFGSPSSFRPEEDCLVFEIGSRFLRAGIAGESTPRCILGFGPEESRRVGDYRRWAPDFGSAQRKERGPWGEEWELWKMDVREQDLGLTEDKLERALREAHVKYLMLDSKPRKAVLAVSPCLPLPLLELALNTIFNGSQPSSVALLGAPLLCTVAAGLRSALVVDIGWHETVITGLFEFREVLQRRTNRGGKTLTKEMSVVVKNRAAKSGCTDKMSFEDAENLCIRLAWCQNRKTPATGSDTPETTDDGPEAEPLSIPISKTSPTTTVSLPFAELSLPAEKAFFSEASTADDNDQPLHLLAWKCLLALPLDVRSICMSRIVVTGGASAVPGLKPRLVEEIDHLIATRGWDPVVNYGSARKPWREVLRERKGTATLSLRPKPPEGTDEGRTDMQGETAGMKAAPKIRASEAKHDEDEITARLERAAAKGREPTVKAVVRGVNTLGAWAGASLIGGLRVQGAVECSRDDFLKNGLKNINTAPL